MLVWNMPALLFISLRLATGAMGHGPEMFQTFNQQHNPWQKFGKIAKTYGALRQGLRWAPMGPMGPMGQPLKKTTTSNLCDNGSLFHTEGPTTENARAWVVDVRAKGTKSNPCSDDRSELHPLVPG